MRSLILVLLLCTADMLRAEVVPEPKQESTDPSYLFKCDEVEIGGKTTTLHGGCFAVSSDVAVTCAHNISKKVGAILYVQVGKIWEEVKCIHRDTVHDIAVLTLVTAKQFPDWLPLSMTPNGGKAHLYGGIKDKRYDIEVTVEEETDHILGKVDQGSSGSAVCQKQDGHSYVVGMVRAKVKGEKYFDWCEGIWIMKCLGQLRRKAEKELP